MFGIAPNQVQDLALGLVQLHGIDNIPHPQPVPAPPNAIQTTNHTTQLGVVPGFADHPTKSQNPDFCQ